MTCRRGERGINTALPLSWSIISPSTVNHEVLPCPLSPPGHRLRPAAGGRPRVLRRGNPGQEALLLLQAQ